MRTSERNLASSSSRYKSPMEPVSPPPGKKTVDEWNIELDRAFEFRLKYGLETKWSAIEALFYNAKVEDYDNSGPNIIASNGDALLSNLGVPYPRINLKPRQPDYTQQVRLLESVDNELIYDTSIQDEIDEGNLNCYLFGRAFLKFGYDSEFGWDIDQDYNGPRQPAGFTFTQHNLKSGERIEFNDYSPGMPWVRSVDPRDILVPWGTPANLKYARWICHRIIRHIDEVMADPKYDKKGKKDLYGTMSQQQVIEGYKRVRRSVSTQSTKNYGDSQDADFVELWEIHDRVTGKVIVIASGHDEFLRYDQDLTQTEHGLPFVSWSFVPGARNFWVTPLSEYLRQQQAELTDIAIQSTKQRRISALKLLYREGSIEEDQLERVLSSRVGAAIRVNNAAGPFSETVSWTPSSQANLLLYQEANQTRDNARETIGFGRNQLGTFEPGGRRTAYEVSQVAGANNLRMSRLQNVIRNVYIESFCRINEFIRQFWKNPRVAQVVGPNGVPFWQQFVGSQIPTKYMMNITFDNDQPETLQSRRQQAMQMYMSLAQDPTVDQLALRQYIANAWNDPEFSALFKPGVLAGQFTPQGPAGVPGPTPQGGTQNPQQLAQAQQQAMLPPGQDEGQQ